MPYVVRFTSIYRRTALISSSTSSLVSRPFRTSKALHPSGQRRTARLVGMGIVVTLPLTPSACLGRLHSPKREFINQVDSSEDLQGPPQCPG